MNGSRSRLREFAKIAAAAIFLAAPSANAAIINMTAYVLSSLYQQDGVTPLADGSIVQIIGSFDNIIDPMEEAGGGYTGNPTGDDVILATIVIDSTLLGIPGTFYASGIFYDNDDIKHAYIRFYNTPGPLEGLIWWGESPIQNIEYDAFGAIFVDFIGGYSTTNENTFVVIPEPNTLNLFLMWAGMLGTLRSSIKREARKKTKERMKGLLEPQDSFPMNTYDRF